MDCAISIVTREGMRGCRGCLQGCAPPRQFPSAGQSGGSRICLKSQEWPQRNARNAENSLLFVAFVFFCGKSRLRPGRDTLGLGLAEIKAALDKYLASRKAKQAELEKAQENLRKVLTARQEAIAALNGLL